MIGIGGAGLSGAGRMASGVGGAGRWGAGKSGGDGGGESGKILGEVLGLCGGEGSGLAGLSGTAGVTLRGETHLERDESGEPSMLRLALFLLLPLCVVPEAPVDGPGPSSIKCLCPREVLGRTVSGLLTAGPGGLSGAVAVAEVIVGVTGMTGTTKSGLLNLTPENRGGAWLVVVLSSWGRPATAGGSWSISSLWLSEGSSTDRGRYVARIYRCWC